MKTILLKTIILLSINAFSQSFNGNYSSDLITYRDHFNPDNNFKESTKFNIFIYIESDAKDGRIVVQDPRIPDKLLIYKVNTLKDFIELDNRWIAIYDCIADHLNSQHKVILTFYISKTGGLNFMVSNDTESQMFFDLEVNN